MRGTPPYLKPALEDGAGAPWRPAERVLLAAGWLLALCVMLPVASAAAGLALAGTLAFWAVAVWILRSDLLHYVIPDEASLALAVLGLALAAGGPALSGDGAVEAGLALRDAAATGAGAFALFWATGAGFRAAGRDALGHGDVKLAGALALWLTPADAALALELAALGAAACLLAMRRGGSLRDTAVPFGAFMAAAAWLVLVLAPPLRGAGWLPW